MKKQVVFIHGGNIRSSESEYLKYLKNKKLDFDKLGRKIWNQYPQLVKALGPKFEVIAPMMPSKQGAMFVEWKIWFEKFIPHLRDDVVLIGHSLGGIFLAKYLAEKKFSRKISSLHLVAAPSKNEKGKRDLKDFKLPKSLARIKNQTRKIFLYHSVDDPVVPFSDLDRYASELPSAQKIILKNKKHIHMPKFPELIENIKGL